MILIGILVIVDVLFLLFFIATFRSRYVSFIRLFDWLNAGLFPEMYWRGPRSKEV